MPTDLSSLTTLRLGGPAARVVEATTTEQLVDLVRGADRSGEPVLLIGGGSNLVISDAGWDGLVVLIRTRGIDWRQDQGGDIYVQVAAGEPWDEFVELSVAKGWTGLAPMSGIPGLVGATPVQNVGAYGSETSEHLTHVELLDRETAEVTSWAQADCGFGFRTSAFKHTDRYVILSVGFYLPLRDDRVPVRYAELARRLGVEPGESAASDQVRETVLDLRRSKGMVLDDVDHDTWSVGSFFVNPHVAPGLVPDGCPNWESEGQVKLSAAWLIENAGFGKGYGLPGPVSLSTKHTLALTNRGGATTTQLLGLAAEIRAGVESRFGIELRPEAHLIGVDF